MFSGSGIALKGSNNIRGLFGEGTAGLSEILHFRSGSVDFCYATQHSTFLNYVAQAEFTK
jgi:hypothetical protein